MAEQKCPDCSANMILVNNRDGTTTFHCEYCGKNIDNQPQSASETIFAFAKRAINAISDRVDPVRQHQAFIDDLKRMRDESSGKKRERLEKQIRTEERALEAMMRARHR